MIDSLRAAIQAVVDADPEGWTVNHWVIAIGLERVTADGDVESTPWWIAQPGQPEYVTDGLLHRVDEIRACTPEYD